MHVRVTMRRLRADMSGATAVIVTFALPVILGMLAYVMDTSRVYVAHRELQAATDAAALAGAQGIYNGTAVTLATSYSATPTNRNAFGSLGTTTSMDAGFPQVVCLTNLATSGGVPCSGPPGQPSGNAIIVQQRLTVPYIFGPVIGVGSKTIIVRSTAAARGGALRPVNIAIVVDVSGSMASTNSRYKDPNCGLGASADKLDCAKKGMLYLLKQFDPAKDKVGLLAFPGVNAGQQGLQTDCTAGPQNIGAPYLPNPPGPNYVLVSMTNDYASSTGSLNIDSHLVMAASSTLSGFSDGTPGCAGMRTQNNIGTYYADAIKAAQTELETNGAPNGQNAIVLLSDGDANQGPSTYQCQRAVEEARKAVNKGTWVYVIAYKGLAAGCATDDPAYPALSPRVTPRTPCGILRAMAMKPDYSFEPTRYWSTQMDQSTSYCLGAQPIDNLVAIFGAVGDALRVTRLIPNGST